MENMIMNLKKASNKAEMEATKAFLALEKAEKAVKAAEKAVKVAANRASNEDACYAQATLEAALAAYEAALAASASSDAAEVLASEAYEDAAAKASAAAKLRRKAKAEKAEADKAEADKVKAEKAKADKAKADKAKAEKAEAEKAEAEAKAVRPISKETVKVSETKISAALKAAKAAAEAEAKAKEEPEKAAKTIEASCLNFHFISNEMEESGLATAWYRRGTAAEGLSDREVLKHNGLEAVFADIFKAETALGAEIGFISPINLIGSSKGFIKFAGLCQMANSITESGYYDVINVRVLLNLGAGPLAEDAASYYETQIVVNYLEGIPEELTSVYEASKAFIRAKEVFKVEKESDLLAAKAELTKRYVLAARKVTLDVTRYTGYDSRKGYLISARSLILPKYTEAFMSLYRRDKKALAMVFATFVANHLAEDGIDDEGRPTSVKISARRADIAEIGKSYRIGYRQEILDKMSEKERTKASEAFNLWNLWFRGEDFEFAKDSDPRDSKFAALKLIELRAAVKNQLEYIQMDGFNWIEHNEIWSRETEFSDELEAKKVAENEEYKHIPTDIGYDSDGKFVGYDWSDEFVIGASRGLSQYDLAARYIWDLITIFRGYPRFENTLGKIADEMGIKPPKLLLAIEYGNASYASTILECKKHYRAQMTWADFIFEIYSILDTGDISTRDGFYIKNGYLGSIITSMTKIPGAVWDQVIEEYAAPAEEGKTPASKWGVWTDAHAEWDITPQWAWRLIFSTYQGMVEWKKDEDGNFVVRPTPIPVGEIGVSNAYAKACIGGRNLQDLGFALITRQYGVDPELETLTTNERLKEAFGIIRADLAKVDTYEALVDYLRSKSGNIESDRRLINKAVVDVFPMRDDLAAELSEIYGKLISTTPVGGDEGKVIIAEWRAADKALAKGGDGMTAGEILALRRETLAMAKKAFAKAEKENPAKGVLALAKLLRRGLPVDIYASYGGDNAETSVASISAAAEESDCW